MIIDYTGQTKGSPLPILQQILRVDDADVIRQPDPNRIVDFRVAIGTQYNACVRGNAEDDTSSEPADDAASEGSPGAGCWLQFRAGVNVRSGPGLDYTPLDMALPDDRFPVLGHSEDGAWWQVNNDGEIGWVSAETSNAIALGDCDGVPVVSPLISYPSQLVAQALDHTAETI